MLVQVYSDVEKLWIGSSYSVLPFRHQQHVFLYSNSTVDERIVGKQTTFV